MVGGIKSVFYFAGIQATAFLNPSIAVNVLKIQAYFFLSSSNVCLCSHLSLPSLTSCLYKPEMYLFSSFFFY